MGTGYKRADITNNIADGNIINAADLDLEYDAIEAAFDEATGHDHGGGVDNGAPITKVGPAQDVSVSTTAVTPKTDNAVDIGSPTFKFKNLYLTGSASVGSFSSATADIDGGTIDGTTIGGTTPAAGTFTTATATTGNITTVNATTVDTTNIEVTNLKAKDGTAAGTIADSTGVVTLNSSVLTTTDINGGTIDGTTIGGSSAAAVTGTTVTATTQFTGPGTGLTGTAASLTAGTVTTNANLTGAVTSVGNATSLGSFTSANLAAAVTDETGTGALVFATSPTLVTPTLGVASATSVTVGAGTVTAPSITTTGDTNTGIYFPAADTIAFTEGGVEAMRIDSSGNVGIGTSSPTFTSGSGMRIERTDSNSTLRLQRSGTSPSSMEIRSGANTGEIFVTSNSPLLFATNGTERMRITSAGDVGIGTSSPGDRLDVRKTTATALGMPFGVNIGAPANEAVVAGSGGGIAFLGAFNGSEATTYAAISGEKANSTSGNTEGVLRFGVRRSTSGANLEAMRIDSAGNVGIGTTSPVEKLHIVGNNVLISDPVQTNDDIRLSPSTANNDVPSISFRNGGVQTFSLEHRGASAPGDKNTTRFIGAASTDFRWLLGSTERMRIDSSGNLLIGKTTATANGGDLQVSSGITFPATQVPKSDANTLDDYEEGTFTPTIIGSTTAGTGTYTSQAGYYTKIGNRIYFNLFLVWTAHTGTGNLRVSSLPFTSTSSSNSACAVSTWNQNIALTAGNILNAYVDINSTSIQLDQRPTGGGAADNIPMDTAGSILLAGNYSV
jgi:hypothetical protein